MNLPSYTIAWFQENYIHVWPKEGRRKFRGEAGRGGSGGGGGSSKANILKQKYEAKLERGEGPNFHGKGVDIFSSVLLKTVCVAVTYYLW